MRALSSLAEAQRGAAVALFERASGIGLRLVFSMRLVRGKTAGLEGTGTTVKVQAVVSLKADFPLGVLLDVAGLARSTFFYHQARLQAPDPREKLKAAVTEIFETNHGRYGHRRIRTEVVKQGWTVAKKTVLKLMRALGLACKVRRRKRCNSYQGEQGAVAPNVLNREFAAGAPNQKWVIDVTEF